MKRIIYTAAALITCASVFGIADYLDARKHGALVNYTDDVQTTEAVVPEKKPEIVAVKEKILLADTKKTIKKLSASTKKNADPKEKDVHYTDIIPNQAVTDKAKDPLTEKVDAAIILESKTAVDTIVQAEEKRKINMEMFSRAPIREKKNKVFKK